MGADGPPAGAAPSSAIIRFFEALGGVLWAPRATLSRTLQGAGPSLGASAALIAALTAAVRPEGMGRAVLVGRSDPLGGLQMGLSLILVRFGPAWIGIFAVGILVALIGRFRPVRYTADVVTDAAALALVPMVFLTVLGLYLDWLGLSLWFLPHTTLVGSPFRVAVRFVVGYGWTLVLWLWIAGASLAPIGAPEAGGTPAD